MPDSSGARAPVLPTAPTPRIGGHWAVALATAVITFAVTAALAFSL